MKKLFISAFALLALATATKAQSNDALLTKEEKADKQAIAAVRHEARLERKALRKLEAGEVSVQSKEAFYADFGDISNVQWKRSAYFDEASFMQDGRSKTAFYDIDSRLVGTTIQRSFEELPLSAQTFIQKKYKGYDIKEVFQFDDNENNESDIVFFGRQFDDADNYFVEADKGNARYVLQISMDGIVSYFTQIR